MPPTLFCSGASLESPRRPELRPTLELWAGYWYAWVGALYLKSYFDVTRTTTLLPHKESDVHVLLSAFVLERALDQLAWELTDRPEWVIVPLHGILKAIDAGMESPEPGVPALVPAPEVAT